MTGWQRSAVAGVWGAAMLCAAVGAEGPATRPAEGPQPVTIRLVLGPGKRASVDGKAVPRSDLIGALKGVLRGKAGSGRAATQPASSLLVVSVSGPGTCTWRDLEVALVAAAIAEVPRIRLGGAPAELLRASRLDMPKAPPTGRKPPAPAPAETWATMSLSTGKDLAVLDERVLVLMDASMVLTIRPGAPAGLVLAALGKALPRGPTVRFRTGAPASGAAVEITPWKGVETVLPVALRGIKPPKPAPASKPAAELPPLTGESFFHDDKAYHVVYVVDRSGSMVESFDAVRHQMLISISRLKAHQGFHVVLFGKGSPKMGPSPTLVPATPANRQAAWGFVKSVNAAGQTDPIPGLLWAFRVLGRADPRKPGKVIHLLTDGNFPDNAAVLAALRRVNTKRDVRIHTYLYGNRPPEAVTVMKAIAKDSGGRYKFVSVDD